MGAIIASSHSLATSRPLNPEPSAKTFKKFFAFKESETLDRILKRHGFKDHEITSINRLNFLPKGLSLSNGENYRVRQTADRKFIEIKIYEPTRNQSYIFWKDANGTGGVLKDEKFATKERRIKGKVNGSLLSSIMNVIPYQWAAHRFMDAYSFDYNLPKELQRGAQFDFRIETKWDDQDLIGYGEILETHLDLKGRNQRRVFVRFPGGGTFVDPENPIHAKALYAPVSYMRLSSLFNSRRFHPIKNRKQPHLGVDFELPQGTEVFAAEGGTVLRSGHQRASGNFIVLRHASGLETYYNHLSEISPSVFAGAQIDNGQKIGAIGCTGYCTKAHLHFAVKRLGAFVDPLKFLRNYPYRSQELISSQ